MAKLIAIKVYMSHLPGGKVAVSFIAENSYNANLFVTELEKHDKLDVTAKGHKESRTLRQNSMLWRVITLISDKINFEHTNESTMKIYGELLVEAQVKYEFMLVLPEAQHILLENFRAVIDTGQRREVNGKELHMYKVFIGSSKFNTKEMGELIDLAIDRAYQVGIHSSELESIRMEHNL